MKEALLAGQARGAAGTLGLEAAVGKERRRLFDFIRRRIADPSEAEDVLQDVFYQLAVDSLTRPIENMAAWLFQVARNRIVDWYRKRRPASADADVEELADDPAEGPERARWRNAVWAELAEALEDLPEEQREVFVAHELEGLSFKQIAERTGEPLNTLLSRKRYAVLSLRERLQGLYDEMESW